MEEQLADIFGKFLFPSMVQFLVRGSVHSETTRANKTAVLLLLHKISAAQIGVSIQPHPEHASKQIRIVATATNATGTLLLFHKYGDGSNEVERLLHVDENQRSGGERFTPVNATVRMGALKLEFDFGLRPDNVTIGFAPVNEPFQLPGFEIDFFHESSATKRLTTHQRLKTVLEHTARTVAESRISHFVSEHIGPRRYSVSKIPPIQ